MAIHKRKNRSGKMVWFYKFSLPCATRGSSPIRKFGFATKQEAIDAEAVRRIEEQKKLDLKKYGADAVADAMPTTLAMLLAEFMKQHASENLSPTTVDGYYRMIEYLSPELLAKKLAEITPLHLSREWARLVKCGGHSRKTKAPRAMKPKSVRNIAGLVSSAFARAIKWGLVTTNPVSHSDLPRVKKRIGLALLPAEQDRLVQCASGPWCLPVFLEVLIATGARRGEVLALRWSDIHGVDIIIDRSLCQTKAGLVFKGTKTDEPRKVEMPPSLVDCLRTHRVRQDAFRRQFGPDYHSDGDLIFANPDGSPLKPDSVSATVSRLCRRLGLPKGASLHSLRHSHASLLLADGVDLATIAARLGHSSVRTTADIYSHAIRGKDHDAALRWDEIRRQSRSEASIGVN